MILNLRSSSLVDKQMTTSNVFNMPTNSKILGPQYAPQNSIIPLCNCEKGIYALLMLDKETRDIIFYEVLRKTLMKEEVTTEDRKTIWVLLSKFYLERNPPDLAILTYHGHQSLIPRDSLLFGQKKNVSNPELEQISRKNHLNSSMKKKVAPPLQKNFVEFSDREGNFQTSHKNNIQSQMEVPQNSITLNNGKPTSEIEDSMLKESKLQTLNVSSQKSVKTAENEAVKEKSINSVESIKWKLTNMNRGVIDMNTIEQIRIDVIRTKQYRISDYHELLKSLIIKFLIRYETKLEYFQGFNYITSFVLDLFPAQEEALLVLDYLKEVLLEDFFLDNLCPKLSLLHFQMNHVIKHHYPLVHAKWKNNEILSEVLFSSFIISLFTSFVIKNQKFIEDFWDIILTQKWEGMIKILLYIIEVFYPEIISMDGNDTMKLFSEMKSDEKIILKFKKKSVKKFVNNLKFNSNFLKDSKKLFLSIERKNLD